MVKIGLFLALSVLSLMARENPFFPPKELKTPSYTTNRVEKNAPFTAKTLHLPSSARVLKSVTLTYENLDGSTLSKEFPINRSVDWHRALELHYKGEPHYRPKKSDRSKKSYKKIASLSFLTIFGTKGGLKVLTKDPLIRHFRLVKPDRLVLDFKRDTDFRTRTFKGAYNFKKITIGNHSGYYRAVIELDGRYIYGVKKMKNGYAIELR